MSREDLLSAEFEAFAHSTEDPKRVFKALLFLSDGKGEVREEKVRGHYGNEVIIYKLKVSKRREVRAVIERLSSLMSESDKKKLKRQLHLRVNGHGNLYLRFDKQKAYLGEVCLSEDEDVVKVKVKFSRSKLEEISETCKSIGLIAD